MFMIGFFMKKAFFDGWDNLISLVILNIGFVVFLGLGYASFMLIQTQLILGMLLCLLVFIGLQMYVGTVSFFSREYAWYKRPGFIEFKECFLQSWKQSLVYACIVFFLLIMAIIVIPFYVQIGSIFGTILVAILFWLAVIMTTALLYYFPIAAQLKDGPKKAIKKSLLIFFDNIGISIFLLLYTLINSIISIFTAFLIPGFASICMMHQIALKLILLKYDYLEENSDADRKKIPWGALLMDEREKIGHRSLKGMIFPWKD